MGTKLFRALALAVAVVACLGVASADTFVVAGKKITSSTAFATAGDEIYAPLLDALAPLKASSAVSAETVAISSAAGRQIALSRQRPEATVDGELHTLPAAPRAQGDALLLPAKAVGDLLGCAVRWDEAARTLYLTPRLDQFLLETTPDCYRLTLAGTQPLSYHLKRISGPLRLVIDLDDAVIAQPFAPFRIENSYLRGVRIAQHALAPDPKGDAVRVVVDLDAWQQYRARLSEDRCRLQLEWPLPGRVLPSDAPPVILSAVHFRRYSDRMGLVTLSTSGKAQVSSGEDKDPARVWVDFDNATNEVAPEQLVVGDRVLQQVSVAPVPDRPGVQRVTLALSEETPYAVSSDRGQVRIVLGACELSKLTVAIDAGHGGSDTGAIGRTGLTEKEVTLDIAMQVGQLLEQAGAKIVYTRCEDTIVKPLDGNGNGSRGDQLRTRCEIANNAPTDLFVSIHCNANASRAHRGTETYYRKLDSLPFARVMQQEVVRADGLPDNGALYHPKSIIVLYRTDMPAVLVEVAYLSNAQDEALLSEASFRRQVAEGVVSGIKRYVSESSILSSLLGRREEEAPAPSAAPAGPPPTVATPPA